MARKVTRTVAITHVAVRPRTRDPVFVGPVGRLLPRSTTTAGQRGAACRFSRCCVDGRAQLYACDLLELNAEDLEQLVGPDGPGLMSSRAIEETPERMTKGLSTDFSDPRSRPSRCCRQTFRK
jgi:hypothetical protein